MVGRGQERAPNQQILKVNSPTIFFNPISQGLKLTDLITAYIFLVYINTVRTVDVGEGRHDTYADMRIASVDQRRQRLCLEKYSKG